MKRRLTTQLFFSFLMTGCIHIYSQNEKPFSNWSFHFQQTIVGQWHPPFHSPYVGNNSQPSVDDIRYSLTSTFFTGTNLWHGAELYCNPEIAGGSGMGNSLGIAGFPNGETFRISEVAPVVELSRLFIRQNINLGDTNDTSYVSDAANQTTTTVPNHRMTITLGKFAVVDMFDNNLFSHDPRTQFMNWALMSTGAWDYPADTRGYTIGIVTELIMPDWSIRATACMVPTTANGMKMDFHILKAHSFAFEFELPYSLSERKGMIRALAYHTIARMGNYQETIDHPEFEMDITKTELYSRSKFGFSLNLEQQVTHSLGAFLRASWNDGKNETWAFTEIDHSLSGGLVLDGIAWNRKSDRAGAAFVLNGISHDHQVYLSNGGYGFIIGDGKLHSGIESIVEAYYLIHIHELFSLTADYQFIHYPAYNKDRGPVHAFALRGHIEI